MPGELFSVKPNFGGNRLFLLLKNRFSEDTNDFLNEEFGLFSGGSSEISEDPPNFGGISEFCLSVKSGKV